MKPKMISILVIVLCLMIGSEAQSKGTINVESYTFDKIASKFRVTLVWFDQAYPWGAKHEAYVKSAQDLKNNPDVIFTEVGIKDYGELENKDFGDRFGVNKDDFPVLKMFLNGDVDKPITFSGEFNEVGIKDFIRREAGVTIVLDQCLLEFDQLANKFVEEGTSKEAQKKLLEESKTKAAELKSSSEKKSAQIYIKLMEKTLERGSVFITSELERVKNILNGKVSEAKKKELQGRINILQSFIVSKPNKDEL